MAVYLVRHAVALGRSAWHEADDKRPLTSKGERQAKALVRLFEHADVRRLYSSPALRCRDSLVPLAQSRGLDIRVLSALAEGHGTRKLFDSMKEAASKRGDSVFCTHGDLVPEVLRRLTRDGMKLESELQFAKGSTWELVVNDGKLVRGHYHPPAE